MVHALEAIHRLLKPGGELIDIHPLSEHSSVEIHQNGKFDLVGHLEVAQWCFDFQQADNALAEIVQRGMFTVEKKGMFDTLTHYDTAAEMGTSLKESIRKYARDAQSANNDLPQADALAVQAEGLLRTAGIGAKLVVREGNHISRLRMI